MTPDTRANPDDKANRDAGEGEPAASPSEPTTDDAKAASPASDKVDSEADDTDGHTPPVPPTDTSPKTGAKKAGKKRKPGRKTGATKIGAKKKTEKVAKVTISHETLVRRVKDARGTALVVLAARAIGGGLITILVTGMAMYVLALVVPPLKFKPFFFLANFAAAAGLVFAAKLASRESMPEAASALPFLEDRAFVWVDPFRAERPHLLPFWLEAILWAPTQVLAGGVPFFQVKNIGETDAEAAAGFARRLIEEGEAGPWDDLPEDSAESRGLRLLLLLRLGRLLIDGGEVKAKVSGLGQTALFEGSVG